MVIRLPSVAMKVDKDSTGTDPQKYLNAGSVATSAALSSLHDVKQTLRKGRYEV